MEHVQLFQNKMINARQMPGGSWREGEGGGRYGHARAIDLKIGINTYQERKQERKSVVEFETNFTKLFICFGDKSKEIAPRPVTVKVTDSLRCRQLTV